MSGTPILRDWFLDGDGLKREVIVADLQSFLGRDATVRPGVNKIDGKEIKGYWIRAYRNLTTAMIKDLKEKSRKWIQEEQKSGRRGNYEDSRTYQESIPNTSPRHEMQYPSGRDVDMMDYTESRPDPRNTYGRSQPPPQVSMVSGAYGEQHSIYAPHRPPPVEHAQYGEYPAPGQGYPDVGPPQSGRGGASYPPGYPGHPGQPGQPAFYGHPGHPGMPRDDPRYGMGRDDPMRGYPPAQEDPRYPPRGDPRYQSGRDNARYPPEDPRYSSSRDDARFLAGRDDPRHQPTREDGHYPPPSTRDDPRYAQAGYQDAPQRYAYPSPATTSTSSVTAHETLFDSPVSNASYAQQIPYDQYGRPYPPQGSQLLEEPFQPAQPTPARMEAQYSGGHTGHTGAHVPSHTPRESVSHTASHSGGHSSSRKRTAGSSDPDPQRRSRR